ncbi:hypothetical protein AN958_05558 [Leucoagaricus sp. SymC.cos]|nr:hypothetical protein AN958_05558 [Leucoagaricus sp. SymC.cos]
MSDSRYYKSSEKYIRQGRVMDRHWTGMMFKSSCVGGLRTKEILIKAVGTARCWPVRSSRYFDGNKLNLSWNQAETSQQGLREIKLLPTRGVYVFASHWLDDDPD